MLEGEIYCPICGRHITASNIEEVESGEHEGFIFIHKDIPHTETDIDALNTGVQ
jgi:uncharacterized Zn finger protein (UPF0148 family)